MQIAIIDLGTNTFNLLLAKVNPNNSFTTIYSGKQAAKIGEGGINKGTITPNAITRAINVLKHFIEIINKHGGADNVIAITTSAVRTAQNKNEFITGIKKHTGIDIRIISGDDEAFFIYEGVRQTVDIGNEIIITLDIGGGSNEFIIADGQRIYWKQSFPLGIARILEQFQPENPIRLDTLKKIERYFDYELSDLWHEVRKYSIKTLIGSSGSFDTYRTILTANHSSNDLSFNIPIDAYIKLHQQLINSTMEERLTMKGIEPLRAEMIVLASIFTNFIVQKLNIQRIIQSDYALKEGVMSLLIKGEFLLKG